MEIRILAAGAGLCGDQDGTDVLGGLGVTAASETVRVGLLWTDAHEFDSETTLCWKQLKTQAKLCGWVLGTEFATGLVTAARATPPRSSRRELRSGRSMA
jgi:hypothetical protein